MADDKKPTPLPAAPLKLRHADRPHGRPNSNHVQVARFGAGWTATCKRCKASVPFVDGTAHLVHTAACDALGQAA